MQETIAQLMIQYPWIATIFMVIGILRLVIKPLMEIAKTVVASTPSEKDDAMVATVEESKAYKAVLFAIDWIFSLKPLK